MLHSTKGKVKDRTEMKTAVFSRQPNQNQPISGRAKPRQHKFCISNSNTHNTILMYFTQQCVQTFAAAEENGIKCNFRGCEIGIMNKCVCTMLPLSYLITTFWITRHLCIY